MRNKLISSCAHEPLRSLILYQMNFAVSTKKSTTTNNNEKNPNPHPKNQQIKTCFTLLEEVVVMNMMFPELREHHLLFSTTLLTLTLIQEQTVKEKLSKFKASPPSLSPATKHSCTQTFESMEGTVPSHSRAALQHRWHMADRCSRSPWQ